MTTALLRNDTLAQLLKLQNNFTESLTIWYRLSNYTSVYETIGVEEAVVEYIEEWEGTEGFYGFFRWKVTQPRAAVGIWRLL